jgi:chromosome segregation ATPase
MGGFSQRDFEMISVEQKEDEWRAAHEPQVWPVDVAGLYRSSGNPALAGKQTELISKLSTLDSDIQTLSAHILASEIEELTAKHEAAYERCRNTKNSIDALNSDLATIQGVIRDVKSTLNRERAALREVQASEPSANSYPTKSELKTWKTSVGKQEARVADAQATVDAANAEHDSLLARKDTRIRAFVAARDEEALLRKRLDILSGKTLTSKSSVKYSSVGLQER